MTLYGWDASHYDGTLTRPILARAKAEGVTFFTHKVAEGTADTEGTGDDTALAAARDVGIPFVGGYFVPRTNATPAAQVARWLQLLNTGEPWWRDHPGFFGQIDLERWPYDNVPASVGIECARRWQDATGRRAVVYASHGQYGDALASWDGPLWNADYTGRPAAGLAAMYPGDGWRPSHGGWTGGWAPYSGREPAILQYTSSATIAGLTTCDANAFRGDVAAFARLIGVRPTALTTPTRGDLDMSVIAKDPTSGQLYHCIGGFSHPIDAPDVGAIKWLSGQGVYQLANNAGGKPPNNDEWEGDGWIRKGWNPIAFGPVWRAPAAVLSDADRTAIADQLGALVPTGEDIQRIVQTEVKAALNGTHLNVS